MKSATYLTSVHFDLPNHTSFCTAITDNMEPSPSNILIVRVRRYPPLLVPTAGRTVSTIGALHTYVPIAVTGNIGYDVTDE